MLPVWMMQYQCVKDGTVYAVEWDPNMPQGEPQSACPACRSPVRVFIGGVQKAAAATLLHTAA